MRGHIWKKGSRYYVVVELDRDPRTGKRRRQGAGGFAKKKDAQTALDEIIHRQNKGTYVPPTKQSVSEFMDEWLQAIRSTVAPKTWASYRQLVGTYVTPRIGAISVRQLSAADLNRLYGDLLENGRQHGRGGLSHRTVRYVHTIVHRALRDAVRWDRLGRNVAQFADPPKVAATERRTWTAEQVRIFMASVEGHRLAAAWLLLVSTGMRKGEVLGLRWHDIDLDHRRLSVQQTLIAVGYEMQFSQPKTNRSRREIALDSRTVAALRVHRAEQTKERLVWGPAWSASNLVFTREDGSPIHPDYFQRLFERCVRRSGLPRITLHGLRHTHATLALKAGVHPKIVSERLGHASVAFTMDVYQHVIKGMQEKAADVISSAIFGQAG